MKGHRIEKTDWIFFAQGAMGGVLAALITAWLFFDLEPISFLLLLFVPWAAKKRWKQQKEKERWRLTLGFRDALLYLKNGLAAGYSPEGSMREAAKGLEQLLGKQHPMTKEMHFMLSQLTTGYSMEQVCSEFAARSKIEEAKQFAELFSIVKRTGGNLPGVIRQMGIIVQEKTELKRELHTVIAAKEAEFRIMSCIPHAILLYLKLCSPSMTATLYHNTFGIFFMSGMLMFYAGLQLLGTQIVRTKIK